MIDAEYVNISISSPLSGNSYIELPDQLRKSMKGLINFKNNDYKCFLLCNIRNLNQLKIHPERMTKTDRRMANDFDYADTNFQSLKKIIARLSKKITFASMYENDFLRKMTWFIMPMYKIKNLKTV